MLIVQLHDRRLPRAGPLQSHSVGSAWQWARVVPGVYLLLSALG